MHGSKVLVKGVFAHQTVDIGQFLMSADISGSTCSDFTALLKRTYSISTRDTGSLHVNTP